MHSSPPSRKWAPRRGRNANDRRGACVGAGTRPASWTLRQRHQPGRWERRMVRLQARLSANVARLCRGEQAAHRFDRTGAGAEKLEMSHAIGRATTLVMAIACGVAAATVYCNQPMLGILEAAFPGRASVIGLVPMATQLGFAVGLLLLVPLGDRIDRRSLILLQLTALGFSLAAAALAPGAWTGRVTSASSRRISAPHREGKRPGAGAALIRLHG